MIHAEREDDGDDTELEEEGALGEEEARLCNLRASPLPQPLSEREDVTLSRENRPRGNRKPARNRMDRKDGRRQNVSVGIRRRQQVTPKAMEQILQAIKVLSEKVDEIDQRSNGAEPGQADSESPGNIEYID